MITIIIFAVWISFISVHAAAGIAAIYKVAHSVPAGVALCAVVFLANMFILAVLTERIVIRAVSG